MSPQTIYYKGTVTFHYISDIPLADKSIDEILVACDLGGAIGGERLVIETETDRAEADRLAVAYGSDTTFFGEDDEELPTD